MTLRIRYYLAILPLFVGLGLVNSLLVYTMERNDWTFSDIPSPTNHGDRIAHLSQPLADFFHGQRGPIATAEEGRTALRMVLATYVSNSEGRRVRLDDPAIAQV